MICSFCFCFFSLGLRPQAKWKWNNHTIMIIIVILHQHRFHCRHRVIFCLFCFGIFLFPFAFETMQLRLNKCIFSENRVSLAHSLNHRFSLTHICSNECLHNQKRLKHIPQINWVCNEVYNILFVCVCACLPCACLRFTYFALFVAYMIIGLPQIDVPACNYCVIEF